jgi:hypothetical protein
VDFDYCIIAAGCNFGPFHKWGESLWFPTIHQAAQKEGSWPQFDERFIEGRRRHILEEYHKLNELNKKKATLLVVGAGFIGVEWVTELEHFFPDLKLTIIDFLPRCLGPLPDIAAEYCSEYMNACGIKEQYSMKYEKSSAFYAKVELPDGPDMEYVCIGVKASNYFMPAETLSDKGPGGGGWIHFNQFMQVTKKPAPGQDMGELYADGTIFAVGDCNYGCIGNPPNWVMPPIPKISYPGEEQALHAVNNLERMDAMAYGWPGCCGCWALCGRPKKLKPTWWPWGAGMFATSLGAHDACFVMAANENKGSGYMVNWWIPAALQKEIIETSKIDECKDHLVGKLIWHFVHHTPCHLWGKGPLFP